MIGGKYGSVAPHIPGMFWSRVVSLFDQRPCERNEHNSTSTQLVTRSRSERDGETLHAGIDTRGVHRTFCLQLAVHMCCARVCLLLLLLLLLQLLLY